MNFRQKKEIIAWTIVLLVLGMCLWASAHLPHKGRANEYQEMVDPEGNVLYVNWKNVIEIETMKRVHALQGKIMLTVSSEIQAVLGRMDALEDRINRMEDNLFDLESMAQDYISQQEDKA